MVLELTDETFDAFVRDNPVAIIDCWAPWCGPCMRMGPIIEEVAHTLAGKAGVAKLNVDENRNTSLKYSIRAIPTILVFKDAVLVDTLVGLRQKEDIIESAL
ncbi:MAG: thioredoxin [Candidatus Methanoplasma sp.]|jgi:thioredoxin 1|nr:thioredoxin [Candidatus Methanoplasma sp.]